MTPEATAFLIGTAAALPGLALFAWLMQKIF